jgi:hypothetical protein
MAVSLFCWIKWQNMTGNEMISVQAGNLTVGMMGLHD